MAESVYGPMTQMYLQFPQDVGSRFNLQCLLRRSSGPDAAFFMLLKGRIYYFKPSSLAKGYLRACPLRSLVLVHIPSALVPMSLLRILSFSFLRMRSLYSAITFPRHSHQLPIPLHHRTRKRRHRILQPTVLCSFQDPLAKLCLRSTSVLYPLL